MNLEAALDRLYAVPPEDFLATRKKLAKEVNPAIASRRKPTTAAYVLNQLARKHAKDVEHLVDVGRKLVRAQRHGGEGLREAIEEQRKTVAEITKEAAEVMRELEIEPSAHLEAVAQAIHAALVDAATGAALEEGRLEKAPELGASFPGTLADAHAQAHAHGHAKARAHANGHAKANAKRERARERAEARAAKEQARAEAKAAREQARAEAMAAKKERDVALKAAREEVARATRALSDARAALRKLQRAA